MTLSQTKRFENLSSPFNITKVVTNKTALCSLKITELCRRKKIQLKHLVSIR